ncbi:cytochrome p450 [Lentinula edodes]|uniref:Cytochrome p450 n=1 Tax=Lentinula edodes TaxID=5353 RepID=A0A1Q3DZE8_LENED|nr:cytochrome p450 [Lentinula edodes]
MSTLSLSPQALALGAIFLATFLIPKLLQWRARMDKLNAIPTVGSSGLFSSYLSARRYKMHAREIIQEGYTKFPGQAFKVPLPDRWEVIVSGKQMMEDIKKASDLDLSFIEAVGETMQSDYTLGLPARVDTYQVEVVRTPLTRNLAARFDDLRDEIKAAFADEIPAKETEWMKVPMLYTVMKIVSRTSNRYFVGLPLCRDPDYINLNIEYTIDAFNGAKTLQRFPTVLKPSVLHDPSSTFAEIFASIVRQFLTDVPTCLKRATKHIEPLIKERLQKEVDFGSSDWPDKPNDLISWLLDEAKGERRKDIIYNIVSRVLLVNFAAIHTTSMTFTNALFYLAANPHLAQPLREEIESTVAEFGWTKAAMGKMWKLDSFLKETTRLSGLGGLTMSRMVLRDFTFSNGTVVPAGTIVSVASYGMHHDDALYEDPETLKPFRFSNKREMEGEGIKHQMVGIDPSFGLFGGGRHMCPGRFFAVNEIKALVGHILVTYDIKFEGDGGYPEPDWNGASLSPNGFAQVMFRKRSATPASTT